MNNQFVQALGVGLFAYLVLKLLGWGLMSISKILISFASWYNYRALPHAEEAAIAFGILYLILSFGFNNRRGS